jgi:hypothetical protein
MSALIRNRLSTALLLAASAAGAQPSELLVTLDFASAPSCPDQKLFIDQVEARVGPEIGWQRGGVSLRLVLQKNGEEFSGRLQHARPDGVSTERVLTGQNCADVVSGLALVAALALDPNASTAPAAELPSTAPAAEEPAPPPQVAKPVAVTAPVPIVAPSPPPAPPREDAASELALPFALGVLGTIGVDEGPAPTTLIAIGGRVDLELYAPENLRPALGVGARYARSGFLGGESPVADFEWVVVRATLCPFAPEVFPRARLRVCALADLGSMTAQGRNPPVEVPERTNQFWFASGPALVLAVRPASPLFVEAGAGGLLAITRPDYVFETPREVVHEVPLFAFSAHLGIGVSFFDQ